MKFTLSWLKDHLETEADLETIGRTLTMIGLEVEAIMDRAVQLDGFVVARIAECGPHPDADKLNLCRVDTGDGPPVQVVCGAPNARTGLVGVFAPLGATIPDNGMVLKPTKIRGVESQGMLCSARELGLGDDHTGIIDLETTAAPGSPAAAALGLEDPVIEIAITPNRGDCLGVRGIARDLAAAGLGTLKPLPRLDPVAGDGPCPVAVHRPEEAREACPRFVGRGVRGVRNGPSPQWMQDRLTAIGLRPISALVDITNYVSVDLGRPLHVFDAGKLAGDLTVRPARDGETLAALNDKTYSLAEGMTVIADANGPQALGGVMGGLDTGCTEATTDVVIESALFSLTRTAATGRALQIDSDARYRFERTVDPQSADWGMTVATHWVLALCGGTPTAVVVAGDTPPAPAPILFDPARVAALGGLPVTAARGTEVLARLGCTVTPAEGDLLRVTPPSWRPDLTGAHDLVEEILRLVGYDQIPAVSLRPESVVSAPALSLPQRRAAWARRCLAGRGLMEAVTWSFVQRDVAALFGPVPESLRLANPISADLDQMRPSVLPHLVLALGRNADRGSTNTALFEVGPAYEGLAPSDQRRVAAGVRGGQAVPRHWAGPARPVDVFDAKADALAVLEEAGAPVARVQAVAEAPGHYHPGRSGLLRLGPKQVLAAFGELHPRVLKALDLKGPVVAFEVFLDTIPEPKSKGGRTRAPYRPSPFQAVERDFAFVVRDDVTAAQVLAAARTADKALMTDGVVFDQFQGGNLPEGHKSVAIALTLQPQKATLTDAEIEAVADKVVAAVTKATGGTLRG